MEVLGGEVAELLLVHADGGGGDLLVVADDDDLRGQVLQERGLQAGLRGLVDHHDVEHVLLHSELLGHPVQRHDPHRDGRAAALHGAPDLGPLLGGVLAGALAEAADLLGVAAQVRAAARREALAADGVAPRALGGDVLRHRAQLVVRHRDLRLDAVGVHLVLGEHPRADGAPPERGLLVGEAGVPGVVVGACQDGFREGGGGGADLVGEGVAAGCRLGDLLEPHQPGQGAGVALVVPGLDGVAEPVDRLGRVGPAGDGGDRVAQFVQGPARGRHGVGGVDGVDRPGEALDGGAVAPCRGHDPAPPEELVLGADAVAELHHPDQVAQLAAVPLHALARGVLLGNVHRRRPRPVQLVEQAGGVAVGHEHPEVRLLRRGQAVHPGLLEHLSALLDHTGREGADLDRPVGAGLQGAAVHEVALQGGGHGVHAVHVAGELDADPGRQVFEDGVDPPDACGQLGGAGAPDVAGAAAHGRERVVDPLEGQPRQIGGHGEVLGESLPQLHPLLDGEGAQRGPALVGGALGEGGGLGLGLGLRAHVRGERVRVQHGGARNPATAALDGVFAQRTVAEQGQPFEGLVVGQRGSGIGGEADEVGDPPVLPGLGLVALCDRGERAGIGAVAELGHLVGPGVDEAAAQRAPSFVQLGCLIGQLLDAEG